VWGVTEYFDLDKQTIYSLVKVLASKSRLTMPSAGIINFLVFYRITSYEQFQLTGGFFVVLRPTMEATAFRTICMLHATSDIFLSLYDLQW